MILVDRPHIVHVVIYLLVMGMRGMKKTEKNVRTRVTVCAAGVWQSPHMAKIRTSRYAFRFIPKMIGTAPPCLNCLQSDCSCACPSSSGRVHTSGVSVASMRGAA